MLEENGLSRRTLLHRALILAGASAAIGACDAIGLADDDSPFRFDAEQLALLTAVADVMIPKGNSVGALDAGVPASFEGLMANWASAETRASMLEQLALIDALDPEDAAFASLPAERQAELLTAHDAAAIAPSDAPNTNPFGPPPATNPEYQRLKQLLVTLYYLSEAALTQEIAYTHAPGEWKPSVPVTPDTRPEGGPGMF